MSLRALARRHGLRWSILAAAGIIPIACSEKREEGPGAGGNGAGGNKAGGSAGKANTPSAGAGAGAGDGGAGGVSATPTHSCTTPVLDPVSGLVSCDEGYEHRPSAVACPLSEGGAAARGAGGAEGGAGQLPRVEGHVSCFHNEDACRAFELGYCDEDTGGGGAPAICKSGCVTDEDCGVGYICLCGGPSPTGGKCHQSDCTTDADCGPGFLCASYGVACGYAGFSCQRASDECAKDDDCSGYCGFNGEHRACDGTACGRPFLIESTARVAPVATTNTWLGGEVKPETEHLSASERAGLAAHWTHMGQLEHASIAAFARFALQLLSLGAPPELVEDCTRAMADETAHTRLCFDIASAYAGQAIGPGPLDISGSLAVTSLADIVELVIVEGCFGETRAALEALEAADAATDPVIRAAYEQIARDEERHAALAFRFVRWALEREPKAVAEKLSLTLRAPATDPLARDIVIPCLRALSTVAQGDGLVHPELLEESTIVARHHQATSPKLERPRQCTHADQVETEGGLVEHQHFDGR